MEIRNDALEAELKAVVFPGQGSQRCGMGADLFELYEFRKMERAIDDVLAYSLREICLKDPGGVLKQTAYTQPCLYIVNAFQFYKSKPQLGEIRYFAGHSLGEYNALHAAGAFDLMTGLRLVKKRGELMSKVSGGAMAAVVGLSATSVAAALKDSGLGSLDIANYNSPIQTVIAGPREAIADAEGVLRRANATMFVQLPVSAPFHSRYMNDAALRFEEYIAEFAFHPLRAPVFSNVTSMPYPQAGGSNAVKSLLVQQITAPVRWSQTIEHLIDAGISSFVEMGPGNVLSRLNHQIEQGRLLLHK